jgi:hypothetical protein
MIRLLSVPRFELHDFVEPDQDGLSLTRCGDAILVWRQMNGGRPCSVRGAAEAFNTTPEAVRAAINAVRPDLFVAGPDETPGTQFIEQGRAPE